MGGFNNGILGFGGFPGFFGGWDGGWGKHEGDKRVVVITAVRAIAASGADFDRIRDWL